jgi:hypothetical protein
MVWAAICLNFDKRRRSELTVMERDLKSSKIGNSANSYINTLEEGLLPVYNGETFLQNNAPVHTAKKSKAWLDQNEVFLLVG